jgi:hypothetical protein
VVLVRILMSRNPDLIMMFISNQIFIFVQNDFLAFPNGALFEEENKVFIQKWLKHF